MGDEVGSWRGDERDLSANMVLLLATIAVKKEDYTHEEAERSETTIRRIKYDHHGKESWRVWVVSEQTRQLLRAI